MGVHSQKRGFMVISQYVKFFQQNNETTFIWHSVFGKPLLVSNELSNYLINKQRSNRAITATELSIAFNINKEEAIEVLEQLISDHYVTESDIAEQSKIHELFTKYNKIGQNKIRYLSLIMSEECNFRCKYCIHFANSKHRFNPEKFMKEEVAKKAIDQYIKTVLYNNLNEAYINFGGGEPLLNSRTILRLLDYIEDIRKNIPIPIKLGINTNASLLTDYVAKALIAHNVEIAASLDGLEDGNNSVRLSKKLKGTYKSIIDAFDILEKNGHHLNGFAMTVTEDNFNNISNELVDWAVSRDMEEIRIDIDVVGTVNISIQEIVDKLMTIRRYGKQHHINIIGFWSRPAENMGLDPNEEDIGFCGGERGNSICVTPSGQVLPCGYSNYVLCNVDEICAISNLGRYQQLIQKRNLLDNKRCKDCPILGFCRGDVS